MTDIVTFLGPSGTFTHQAVLALRPDAEPQPVSSAVDALGAVADGSASCAVLPVDNTVNGVVVPTLDGLLGRPGLAVVDSVVVPVSFNAYTLDPTVAPRLVVSHPHALAQCRGYVEALGAATREAASTAAACRDLAPGEVGLGPAVCGELYPIRLLAEAVEDHDHAYTQFALVARESSPAAVDDGGDEGDGGDGLVVALSPRRNVPGILRRLLEVLEVRELNMTNLVTRPVPTSHGEFVFLLFLAGRVDAEAFSAMGAEWSALGCRARALGRLSPLAELVRAHGR